MRNTLCSSQVGKDTAQRPKITYQPKITRDSGFKFRRNVALTHRLGAARQRGWSSIPAGKGISAFPHHFRLERYVFKVLKYARITSIYSTLILVKGKSNPFLGREEASDQLYQIGCNLTDFFIPAPVKLTVEPVVRLKAFFKLLSWEISFKEITTKPCFSVFPYCESHCVFLIRKAIHP